MTNLHPFTEGLTFIDRDMLAAAEKMHVAESLAYLPRSSPCGREQLIDAACSRWESSTADREALVAEAIRMQPHDWLQSFRSSKRQLPLASALALAGLNDCLAAWSSFPTAGAMVVGDPISCAVGAGNDEALRILEPVIAAPPPPPEFSPAKAKGRRMGADLAQSRLRSIRSPFRSPAER